MGAQGCLSTAIAHRSSLELLPTFLVSVFLHLSDFCALGDGRSQLWRKKAV